MTAIALVVLPFFPKRKRALWPFALTHLHCALNRHCFYTHFMQHWLTEINFLVVYKYRPAMRVGVAVHSLKGQQWHRAECQSASDGERQIVYVYILGARCSIACLQRCRSTVCASSMSVIAAVMSHLLQPPPHTHTLICTDRSKAGMRLKFLGMLYSAIPACKRWFSNTCLTLYVAVIIIYLFI